MLNVGVMVSGGGTNLQAILDAVDNGAITNAQIRVVISNNPGAYALERAKNHGIEAVCISPKSYETRDGFNEAFLAKVDEYDLDLIVLAGFLVAIPEAMTRKYEGKIINIHPSLIPSFCGKGYYGLKVHEAALKRGVKVTGATVHFVDSGMDTGPIILQKAVEAIRRDGCEVIGMVAAYTYGFPVAEEAFKNAKVPLVTLTNYEAVLDVALRTGYIEEEDIATLNDWRKDPAHWDAGK